MEFLPSNHPLIPPLREEDSLAWLRLLRSRRVGPSTFYRLMAEHGSAEAALSALPEIARAAGVDDYSVCPTEVALNEMHRAKLAGATLIAAGSDLYPEALADLPDAPPLLWVLGDVSALTRAAVAVVGARNASSLGLRMARSLSTGLGDAGFATISGLARGIDTEVHKATLATGTVAVMAGGVDVIYPPENAVLAQEIGENGCLVSEQPMGMKPIARHFPRRNRLISGLARAVVVVEAAAKSGTLITARDALDQGREVLAVPGHPFDARAAGCNLLIRDGATLVRGPKDVLEALHREEQQPYKAPSPEIAPKRTLIDAHILHRQILDRLGPSPSTEDQLIRDLGLPAGPVADCLTRLELDGAIQREAGGLLRLSC
ncbi:DNA-processing protein DprA [Palleronia abyssalis]|uniref:DNA processing protein DprA n=1 Tax=Palleronia abyssalis TaxID=1501240 RepID=A0A2R8BXC5_9RHOB|nr:DNA-processing protein DprA [Palleronia abyssalis]SPJ24772.1 DNA processing protein DprA [Palleronia abyssalis]